MHQHLLTTWVREIVSLRIQFPTALPIVTRFISLRDNERQAEKWPRTAVLGRVYTRPRTVRAWSRSGVGATSVMASSGRLAQRRLGRLSTPVSDIGSCGVS